MHIDQKEHSRDCIHARGCINPINLNNTVEYRCTLIRKNIAAIVYTFISDSIWTLQKHYRQWQCGLILKGS